MSCDCGKKFLVDAAQRGTVVKCPVCSSGVKVPDDRVGVRFDLEADDERIEFGCPKCGQIMKARTSHIGRETNCPKCKSSVTIATQATPRSPSVKKSSSGLLVALGAVLLLLIGGIVLAVLLMRKGGVGSNAEIDDLSLVPANAQTLVCVKVGTLWQTAAVQKAVRDNPDKPNPGKQLESETGLKPEEIERATVVMTDSSKNEGWIVVKTKKPYDAQALQRRIRSPRQMTHLDRPYTVGVNERNEPVAFAAVSPSVLVFGKEEGVRQALGLIGSPITKGPLAPIIEMCKKEDHVVFGYNRAAGRIEGSRGGFDLSSFNDMELLRGTFNVREQAELDARARADSNENAEQVRGKTVGLIAGAKGLLSLKQFFPGEVGENAKRDIKLLNALKVSADDRDVVATMKADPDLVLPFLLGMSR